MSMAEQSSRLSAAVLGTPALHALPCMRCSMSPSPRTPPPTTHPTPPPTRRRHYHYPDGARLKLAQILVLPPHQGRGAGGMLLGAAQALAEELNACDLAVRPVYCLVSWVLCVTQA